MLSKIVRRLLSSHVRHIPEHRALVIKDFGDPTEKVTLQTRKHEDILPKTLAPNQVLVEHLAACVNPADINLVQGVYGIRPPLPAVMGNEGITRVLATGSGVKHLGPGDIALGVQTLGYWQSYSVQESDTFYKVDEGLDVTTAAQLKVNPCTAYRMMKDFCSMKPGDVMVQNGANSAVGVYAIQLAKHWGIKTINVIRDRPEKNDIIQELVDYGADYVVTEEQLRDIGVMKPILKQIGKPKLFLNCVGGKNALDCLRTLDDDGVTVTYGVMSKQPLQLGGQPIFKGLTIAHFWVSRWYKLREPTRRNEVADMLQAVSGMFKSGVLKPKSSTLINFEDRNVAFTSPNNTKYIFSINK